MFLCVTDKPSAPLDLKCTGFIETSISLSWDPSKDDAGFALTVYYVERRESSKLDWTPELEVNDVRKTSRGRGSGST